MTTGTSGLTIRSRLAIGFGVVVLLVCCEAAVSRRYYDRVERLETTQRTVILPAYETVRDLRTDLLRRAVALRSYALTGEVSFRGDADTFESAMLRVSNRLSLIDANADAELLARIARSLPECAAVSRRFVELIDDKASIERVTGTEQQLDAIRSDLLKDIDRFSQLETARLDRTNAEIEVTRAEARSSLLLCWLLVVAATGLTGVVTARAVRRPALELLKATRALSSGDFGPAVALADTGATRRHRNEMKELAAAFGRTAIAVRERDESVRALAAELQDKNELLRSRNESLQEQAEEIQAQNEELQCQTDQIQAQNERLRIREELLQRQNTELGRQKDELAVLHRQKDHFLSIASHELRTPITTLKLQAYQLVRRSTDNPEWQPMLPAIRAMETQASRLNDLITRMLDASRAAGRRIELRRQRVDLADLARLAGSQAQTRTTRHNVVLEGVDAPIFGEWDGGYLEQVLTNLLENAIRYSPEGGDIVVRLQEGDQQAILSVTDHGIGIPEDAQHQLFRPYFRHDGARGVTQDGLGLGLYVTREIVQAHGGTISVVSRPGSGTTFTVVLPRSVPEASQASA